MKEPQPGQRGTQDSAVGPSKHSQVGRLTKGMSHGLGRFHHSVRGKMVKIKIFSQCPLNDPFLPASQ